MRFKTAFAQTPDGNPAANARAAVRKIREDFSGAEPVFVVFFAATDYDPDILAAEMHDAFPGAVTMGCTTAGEACGSLVLKASVVAMAFSGEVFDFCETALVTADKDIAAAGGTGIFSDPGAAVEYLGRNLRTPPLDLDHRQYVGFMLGDRFSTFAESVLERVGEMTNVFFAGGIAGDDGKFEVGTRMVFYRGKAYRNGAAALALWKPRNGFSVVKTQAVELTDKQFTITKADEAARTIWELDGRNAVEAYAEAIGTCPENLAVHDYLQNPLGLVAEGEPYLMGVWSMTKGGGLEMLMPVREGMRLRLTRARNVVGRTKADLAAGMEGGGKPGAILHVNCMARYETLRMANQVEEFGRLFEDVPHIAFLSYGEIFANTIAITSVMILFK